MEGERRRRGVNNAGHFGGTIYHCDNAGLYSIGREGRGLLSATENLDSCSVSSSKRCLRGSHCRGPEVPLDLGLAVRRGTCLQYSTGGRGCFFGARCRAGEVNGGKPRCEPVPVPGSVKPLGAGMGCVRGRLRLVKK